MLSNLDNKKIVDQFLSDLAEGKHTSSSVQAEKCLLDAALPQNEDAAYYIRNMYVMGQPVNQVLQNIYDYMGSGLNEKPRYNNALDLVRFCEQLSLTDNSAVDETNVVWINFDKEMTFFIKLLENNATSSHTYEANYSARHAKELQNMLNDDPNSVRLHNIWHTILNNWSYLCNYKAAYRLMSYLSALQTGFQNTAENRARLVDIVKVMSTEWN